MKRWPIQIPSLLLATLALGASTARAQEPSATPAENNPAPFARVAPAAGGFGATGQWVLTMQTAFGGSSSGFLFLHKTSGGGSEIAVHPAADYFLTSTITVGGVLGVDSASGGSTTLDIGGRAGLNLNINGYLGFWPTAGVFASHTSNPDHSSSSSAGLEIFAPFLYHPAAHFFVGLGPSFDISFNNNQQKDFGIDFVIGGWI
jgi:hypothetical protein